MVRNKHSYKKLAGDGLFSDVQVSRKIWQRKESLHTRGASLQGKELEKTNTITISDKKRNSASRRGSVLSPSDPSSDRGNLKQSNLTTERESAFMASEHLPDHLIKSLKEDKNKE